MTYTITITLSRSDSDIEVGFSIPSVDKDDLLKADFPIPGVDKLIPLLDEGIAANDKIDFDKAVATTVGALVGERDVN